MYSNGETTARAAASRVHASVATVTLLGQIPFEERVEGMTCLVTADNSEWMFSLASTSTDTTNQLVVTPADALGGRWLRTDRFIDLKMAVDFTTADAAVLFTVPVGFKLRVTRSLWENTTPWTGGASSTVGLSSSNAAFATKGDLLGAAAGDATALMLVASPGPYVGANGTRVAGAAPVVLVAGNTIRFDRITSVYTAGAGFAHVGCEVLS